MILLFSVLPQTSIPSPLPVLVYLPSLRTYQSITPERCCLIWAENIPEFQASNASFGLHSSCGIYSNEWSAGVCVCVCMTFREREELFISSPFRSFSLPPDPHVQQLRGKSRIANQLPEKIELIGRPRRLLVKVWADVSTLPLLYDSTAKQLHTAVEQSRGRGGSKLLHNNKTTLCESINKALQSEWNFPS